MADKHCDEGGSSSNLAESSESTVEIRIKTLDSQSYQFRVDKNMLVSAFKEKIATDVNLPVGQQRLIFRGKVLKDELRLSEYHVGSGDTLHLVARQPSESQPSSGTTSGTTTAAHGTNPGQNANGGGPRPRVSHISHSVVLGTFGDRNEDGNGNGNPDISRVIGAVLNSIGIGGQGQGQMSMGGPIPNMQFNVPVQGNESGGNGNNGGQQGNPSQPSPQGFAIPLGPGMSLPTLVTPIPDSLHTLSEFMNRMEQALSHNGYQQNQPANGGEGPPPVVLPTSARGVPTPAALATVMRHAQQLLNGPVTNSLSHTARRLEEEESCTDVTVRTEIQSEAMQSGLAMQHLGALLLELGRTMLTLRVGQSPAESSVNAGPSIYISSTGPNPIMVQPFPLQTHTVFGGPVGPTPFGVPRHINVHIHAGVGGPRGGTNAESNQGGGQPATNETTVVGPNLESRGVDVSTRSENPASQATGQPDGSVSEPEPQKETEVTANTTIASSSSVTKPANEVEIEVEGASSSSTPANDNSKAPSSTVPLGLGLGGLQPKRRSRPVTTTSSNATPSPPLAPVNAPTSSPGGSGQLDAAAMMSQMAASPALDGLLSGVSSQTGMGSPDMLRNMLGQLTQNPAMMNTVNQIAQQIDGNQDLSNMFSGSGGGGFDLSGMIQQMMPIVAQAFGGGGGGGLNMLQQTQPSVDREVPSASVVNDSSSDSDQVNVRDLAEKIQQQESPDVVFSSVVEAAAARLDNGNDGLSDLLIQEGLVDEFMEMLKSDVSRLVEEEGEGEGK